MGSTRHARRDPPRRRSPRPQDLLTGFGLRTLSSADQFFEPTAYHRGTVWPFDNAVVVTGLLSYGFVDEAMEIAHRVVRAIDLIGTPIELYAVASGDSLIAPDYPRLPRST